MAEENSSRYLPEELQEKILVRLPVKSIVRFESVSKSWQSMFHSRRFIGLFGRRHPDGDSRTIRQAPNIFAMIPGLAERESGWPSIRVLGPSSNGIYCVTSHYHYESRDDRFSTAAIMSGKIVLCNPATHHYKFIDPFPAEFHPLLSQVSSNSKPCRLHFGFGCVENNNIKSHIEIERSYSVVVLVNYDGDGGARLHPYRRPRPRPPYSSFLIFVYNYNLQSGGGKWKKIVDYDPGKRNVNVGRRKATEAFSGSTQGTRIIDLTDPLEVCPQRLFEGCFHWMAIGEDRSYVVLSYNFVDESFKLIGAPQRQVHGEVFVLHHHLAVIKILEAPSPSVVDLVTRCAEVNVWMMMEYGVQESWARIYTITPNNLYVNICRLYGIDYCPLQSQSGGIRIKRIFFKDGNKQQIISCKDGGHKVVDRCDRAYNYCWNTSGISTYVETLERF